MTRSKRWLPALVLGLVAVHAEVHAQAAPGTPVATAREAFVVERTVWIRPGRTAQYMALFDRVERPRLDALRQEGKVLWYRIAQPMLAARNDDWDLRATVAWRSPADADNELRLRTEIGRGRGANGPGTEKGLLDELVEDQQERWLRESASGP